MKPRKTLNYRYKIDFELAGSYAKPGCKHCLGRGYLEYRDIGAIEPRYDYCKCTRKFMKKYGR